MGVVYINSPSVMISALPSKPQDVTTIKVAPSIGDDCIIVVNWNP